MTDGAVVKIRSKVVIKEAMQLTETCDLDEIRDFLGGEDKRNIDFSINYVKRIVRIGTLEGNVMARVGDWIIRGLGGEFYPCKPDIFAATYEVIE